MLQAKVAFLTFPLIYRTQPSTKQKSFPQITAVLLTARMQPSPVGQITGTTWTAKVLGTELQPRLKRSGHSPKSR